MHETLPISHTGNQSHPPNARSLHIASGYTQVTPPELIWGERGYTTNYDYHKQKTRLMFRHTMHRWNPHGQLYAFIFFLFTIGLGLYLYELIGPFLSEPTISLGFGLLIGFIVLIDAFVYIFFFTKLYRRGFIRLYHILWWRHPGIAQRFGYRLSIRQRFADWYISLDMKRKLRMMWTTLRPPYRRFWKRNR